MSKRKDGPPAESQDKMEITPLGAGNEVGRSCVLMSYKGKNVLFDCGIHPGYAGFTSLPFFDVIDTSTIDVLLVTHFHLDHAASLPYFLEKTDFKGRVFMTHATKAVYYLLLSDFVKVSKVATEDMLFDEKDINRSMEKIEAIDFHQTQEVNGIKFWCYTAGHVLGAAMFMVDIAGVRVLYTGDYSREEDRHLKAAELPPFSPELCIIESTYGVQLHERREDRERRFTDLVVQTVLQGGKVLIPAFALGRAQELLLILDEYWSSHPEVRHVPIYYASPLANKCMSVYQTYVNAMNDRIRQQFEQSNPFEFQYIKFLKTVKDFDAEGPVVVMASPGGLQSGLSRQLFDEWCQDKKNTCLIPGYVVEGTLAKTLLSEPKEVALSSGLVVPLRMRVRYISFSAHADYAQTSEFLTDLKPPNIVLVHGEATEMGRLKGKLTSLFEDQGTKVLTPKNCQTVEFFFKGEKMAKAVGKLAESLPKEGSSVSGLLVKKGFSYQLLAPDDLPIYTQLSTGSILQRQAVPYSGGFGILKQRLSQMFEDVETLPEAEFQTLRVHETVTVYREATDRVVLQWNSDPVNDMVADSIVALILRMGKTGAESETVPRLGPTNEGEDEKVKTEKDLLETGDADPLKAANEKGDSKFNPHEVKIVHSLLENLFGEVDVDEVGNTWTVKVDGSVAVVDETKSSIDCSDEKLRERIEEAFRRIRMALHPLSIR